MEDKENYALNLIRMHKLGKRIRDCRIIYEINDEEFRVYAGDFEYLINSRIGKASIVRDFRVPRGY